MAEGNPTNMSMPMWLLLGGMALNGAGTVATSSQVSSIQAGMLDDVQTRRWIEDGADRLATMRTKIQEIKDHMARNRAEFGREMSNTEARMNRMAELHQADMGRADKRIERLGILIADILRRIPAEQQPRALPSSSRIRQQRASRR